MPGNLLAGEFVELCPVGIGSVVDSGHHAGHGAHHDGAAVEHDPNKSCPLGLGIKFLGTPVVDLDVPALEPPAHRVLRLIDADARAIALIAPAARAARKDSCLTSFDAASTAFSRLGIAASSLYI